MAQFYFFDGGACDITFDPPGAGIGECTLTPAGDVTLAYNETDVVMTNGNSGNTAIDGMILGGEAYVEFTLRKSVVTSGGTDNTAAMIAALLGKATADATASKTAMVVENPAGVLHSGKAGILTIKPHDAGVATTVVGKHIIIPKAAPLVAGNISFGQAMDRGLPVRFRALVSEETIDTVARKVLIKTGANPA